MNDVICFGSAADETFSYTVKRLAYAGMSPMIIDLAHLAMWGCFHIDPGNAENSWVKVNDVTIGLTDKRPIWLRLVDISEGAPTLELQQRVRENYYVLSKFLSLCTARIVNPPEVDMSNVSKFYHQHRVNSVGFLCPPTILTNIAHEVLAFVEEHKGQVIYKGASAAKTIVSSWSNLDKERLELLNKTPVLFQKRIVGPDVRVHTVGSESFGEMILSAEVDYRFGSRRSGNQYSSIELPHFVKDGCAKLTQLMGTPFLGVDFKLDSENDEWYILEANSMPCYQGYDKRANGAISTALANYLLG